MNDINICSILFLIVNIIMCIQCVYVQGHAMNMHAASWQIFSKSWNDYLQ